MRLFQIGAVVKVTGLDASFLAEHFDEQIDELYPMAAAILQRQRDQLERD